MRRSAWIGVVVFVGVGILASSVAEASWHHLLTLFGPKDKLDFWSVKDVGFAWNSTQCEPSYAYFFNVDGITVPLPKQIDIRYSPDRATSLVVETLQESFPDVPRRYYFPEAIALAIKPDGYGMVVYAYTEDFYDGTNRHTYSYIRYREITPAGLGAGPYDVITPIDWGDPLVVVPHIGMAHRLSLAYGSDGTAQLVYTSRWAEVLLDGDGVPDDWKYHAEVRSICFPPTSTPGDLWSLDTLIDWDDSTDWGEACATYSDVSLIMDQSQPADRQGRLAYSQTGVPLTEQGIRYAVQDSGWNQWSIQDVILGFERCDRDNFLTGLNVSLQLSPTSGEPCIAYESADYIYYIERASGQWPQQPIPVIEMSPDGDWLGSLCFDSLGKRYISVLEFGGLSGLPCYMWDGSQPPPYPWPRSTASSLTLYDTWRPRMIMQCDQPGIICVKWSAFFTAEVGTLVTPPTLEVTVVDSKSDDPLSGVTVSIVNPPASKVTNAEGEAIFPMLAWEDCRGSFQVNVTAPDGYLPDSGSPHTVDRKPGGTATLTVYLTPDDGCGTAPLHREAPVSFGRLFVPLGAAVLALLMWTVVQRRRKGRHGA